MNIQNILNENRKFTEEKENFHVLEHEKDESVLPKDAANEYFMSKMNIHKKQVFIQLDQNHSVVTQAGAMQWTCGNVQCESDTKGIGDFLGKAMKGAVTKESAVKPKYTGVGMLVLEPTYKHILLENAEDWGDGIVIEDGMFLACDANVKISVAARANVSSAALGGEGLFNLSLSGNGVIALESNVPRSELIKVILHNEELKIDGSLAVCWSKTLSFTVEKSTKSLIGSAVSGEGLVNVYRGTGIVLMSPVADSNIPVSNIQTK